MVTKHFFKILFVFMFLIAIGMVGVLMVSNFIDTSSKEGTDANTQTIPIP